MNAIYRPKGQAAEYAPLAVNLFTGCRFACTYCYCPAILHTTLAAWSADPRPRAGILDQLDKDARLMAGCTEELLLCFMCDPYQSPAAVALTRSALLILERAEFKNVTVLTKAGMAAAADFDILKRNRWSFGSTISLFIESSRKAWEPHAAPILDRMDAIYEAKERGIRTWVSVEPVINPGEALMVMQVLLSAVDFWKVGKINYNSWIEKQVDWKAFAAAVRNLVPAEKLYIKKDLAQYE